MVKSTIITNPVNINIHISRGFESWTVRPGLTAFPAAMVQQAPKNIIFLLDNSGSMHGDRLSRVKMAVNSLLDKLSPSDTFSVLSFNTNATERVSRTVASTAAIAQAKKKITAIDANGSTDFSAPFIAVDSTQSIPPTSDTSIIFLTDGQCKSSSADDLLRILSKHRLLRVIPIGILDSDSDLLNALAKKSGGGEKALYINDRTPNDYQKAFGTAFDRIMESSQSPAQLDMNILARDGATVTAFDVTRTLTAVRYDGSSVMTALSFNSPIPPQYLKFCFHCDDRSLQADYALTSAELAALAQGQPLNISIPAFKWKNNTASSWLLALGAVAIGLLLLTGVALFIAASPPLSVSLLLWKTLAMIAVAVLTGLSLLLYGMLAVLRKTIFLPTKLAAVPEIKGNTEVRLSPVVEKNLVQPSAGRSSAGLFKPLLLGGVCAAGGATAGYATGTVTAATAAVVATGISPSLFIAGCAVGGAIALPLLVYGCMQLAKKQDISLPCFAS